jgi:chromosome partitioning protein
MRTIAIANLKGGSGKTTTAVNLAATLAERGRSVLLLDLDPQCSASQWLGLDTAAGTADLLGASASLDETTVPTRCAGLYLVPASTALAGTERSLARELGAEMILRRRLDRGSQRAYDYLLIDCPPAAGVLTLNALTAATEVLVPVEAHVMALHGVAQLMDTLAVIRERLNSPLDVAGILACRVDGRTRHGQEVVQQLRARFGDLVFQTQIRENVRLAEAPSFGEPIIDYDGRSLGAADYRSLASEVIAQENGR